MAVIRRKTMGIMKQLIDQRLSLLQKANVRIETLESFLLKNNTEEEFSVSFRFQGSLEQNPIRKNVGKAQNQRYVAFGWDKDKKTGDWGLFYEDTNKFYGNRQKLTSAENYYKLSFIERMGVFLERMEQSLFESNDLVEKGLEKMNDYIESNK